MNFEEQVKRECDTICNMLVSKNKAYGNSALNPVRVFSKSIPTEQILVRIDDKLSRLQRGKPEDNEDTVLDLIGYLILLRISKTPETTSETLKPRCSFCGGNEDYAGQHVHVIPPNHPMSSFYSRDVDCVGQHAYVLLPKSQSPDGDDGRVQPGQKSHAEIIPVPQSSDSSASGDIPDTVGQVSVGADNRNSSIVLESFEANRVGEGEKPHPENPKPKEVHLPAEIIPFKEAEAFTYNKLQFFKQVGKIKVFLSGENIAIYHPAYNINVFTSVDEIKRMKALSEIEIKLTLQDYEKRTYPNKAVVLRHFLRELKSADELKSPAKPAPIKTYSKLSELDDIRKTTP